MAGVLYLGGYKNISDIPTDSSIRNNFTGAIQRVGFSNTVPLYNATFNMNFDITWSYYGLKLFFHGLLQRNVMLMTINCPLRAWFTYSTAHSYEPKQKVIKGQHCIHILSFNLFAISDNPGFDGIYPK